MLGAEDEREDLSRAANALPLRRRQIDHDVLMALMDERLQRGVSPFRWFPTPNACNNLGSARRCGAGYVAEMRARIFRKALDELQKDRSFDWSLEDDTFHQLDNTVASNVDFVLSGHTHLERALRRRKRNGFYFNSGTWARLIRLEPHVLADQTEFNKVYGALAAGTMDALDKFPGLVSRRRTVVAVKADSAGTRGELLRWDTVNGKLDLIPVDPNAGMTKT